MAERPTFLRTQAAFAAHIRDPDHNAAPGDVEPRRMAVYREVFFNNIESFVSSGFPVLRSLYEDADWQRLVRGFYAEHRCSTPYFLEIAREFLRYLEHERRAEPTDPPFLLELAHYEWVELALQIAEEPEADETLDPDGDLLEGTPVLSSLAWPLCYRFPVHRISRNFRPREADAVPTHLLVMRDIEEHIRFHEISATTARLLARLQAGSDESGRALLLAIAEELHHPDPDAIVHAGGDILRKLRTQGAIMGTRSAQV